MVRTMNQFWNKGTYLYIFSYFTGFLNKAFWHRYLVGMKIGRIEMRAPGLLVSQSMLEIFFSLDAMKYLCVLKLNVTSRNLDTISFRSRRVE